MLDVLHHYIFAKDTVYFYLCRICESRTFTCDVFLHCFIRTSTLEKDPNTKNTTNAVHLKFPVIDSTLAVPLEPGLPPPTTVWMVHCTRLKPRREGNPPIELL